MKLIKIGAVWCSGCLIMNNVIGKIRKKYQLDLVEYDIDMDEEEAKKYHPGDILPVFIVEKEEKEITRFCGEFSYEDFLKKLKDAGVVDEEIN